MIQIEKQKLTLLNASLALLALITFWSGTVYYFYRLNQADVWLSLILSAISFYAFCRWYNYPIKNQLNQIIRQAKSGFKNPLAKFIPALSRKAFIPRIIHLLLIMTGFVILFQARTDESIISPWETVPPVFFLVYAAASLALMIVLFQSGPKAAKSNLPLIIHLLLSLSVSAIVYRVGFGFDPFVHNAALDVIAREGAVLPKTPYYSGYYGLAIIIHQLLFIPLRHINVWIVPVLSALFLPPLITQAAKDEHARRPRILAAAALILPASFLTFSTPQNFGYLLLLMTILKSLSAKNRGDFALICALAMAAALVHPIAGVPALFLCLLMALYRRRIRPAMTAAAAFAAAVTLPALFLAMNPDSLKNIQIAPLLARLRDFSISLPMSPRPVQNFIYLYGDNFWILYLALAAAGAGLAWKNSFKNRFLFAALSVIFFLSFIMSMVLPFEFLIHYERLDYANRILIAAACFALPFVLAGLDWMVENILNQSRAVKIIFTIFFSGLSATSLYLAYPRFDSFHNSRSHSTGRAEIEAVRRVAGKTQADYIVLANQQVSAAALHEFGFKKYYKDEIFFYPIPTGGPLYQYYLDMVYKQPDQKTMTQAMDLAGVKTGYFVLNKYWWAFDKIANKAKLSADSWESVSDGNLIIFEYLREQN